MARGLLGTDRARVNLLVAILVLVIGSGIAALGCGGGSDINNPNPTLTIQLAGTGQGTVTGSAGSINCTNTSGSATGTCQAPLDQGTSVTLTATPANNSSFAGWGGDAASCPANAPCTVSINGNSTVTATFNATATTHTLTVTGGGAATGSGHVVSDPAGIDCEITSGQADDTGCSAPFDAGQTVQLQVQSGSLVAWGGACSGSTCSVTMTQDQDVIATFGTAQQATQLVFVGQPSGVQVGNVISPPVQVAIQDANGQIVSNRTDAITLQIGANPGNATLGGTATKNAVNGVATFSDLTMNQAGENYTLVASSPQLPSINSAAFTVSVVPVPHLVFTQQPSNTQAGVAINPAVVVQIQDQNNVVMTSRTDEISISLQSNPGGGSLSGTVTATAVAGVATFPNLILVKAGNGYTLAASTANASGALSNAFNVSPGQPAQLVSNANVTRSAPAGAAVANGDRPSVKVLDAFNNPVPNISVNWAVTAGGGAVDPASRSTGPMGVSIVISWTLGPNVGTDNNELQASLAGASGSPVTFKASGTLPSGDGLFTGTLKTITNTGVFGNPIANATVTFKTLPNETIAGTTTTRADGSFTSPPVPGANQYKIDITADNFKPVTFQKPGLNAGATFLLGDLGMVGGSNAQGQASTAFRVDLADKPDAVRTIRVEVYKGFYVGPSDEEGSCGDGSTCSEDGTANILQADTQVLTDGTLGQHTGMLSATMGVVSNGADIFISPLGDWGPLTVRVRVVDVTGETVYQSEDRLMVLDNPQAQIGSCLDSGGEGDVCNDPFELNPAP
jgi:hypothetical protein